MSVDTQPTPHNESSVSLNDRWGRFTGWLRSLTPEGREKIARDQLIASINAAGAATQLWMTELTRQQLQAAGTLKEGDQAILDDMSARFSKTMVENGADPSMVMSAVTNTDQS